MRFITSCAAAALLVSGHSFAQENGLDSDEERLETVQVVGQTTTFGATKSEIPVLETPRSLTIISEEEFLEKGALSLSNTLSYTAGVTGEAFGFATRGDFTSIRGLDAPEYQDNLQVLFGFYNNARADIYTLEQVEVLKGPASVLYGQAAPGGILSTISKVAGPDNLENEVVLTAGSHDRYQAGVDFGFDLSGNGAWTARLVGLVRDSGTQVDFVDDNALVIAPSITYQNERASVTALLNFTDRESDTSAQFLPLAATACGTSDVTISEANVCAGSTGQQVDNSVYVGDPNFNKYDTQSTTLSVFGTYQINDFLNFEGTARYRDNEAEYDQTWISFLGDGNPRIFPDGTAFGRSWSSAPAGSDQFAFDARLRAKFETGPIGHEVLGGINYQDVETFVDSAFLYAQPTTFNIFNPVYDGSEIPDAALFDAVRGRSETETVATDFYLTDQMSIGNLIVNAGIRFSSVESEDATSDQEDEETPITFGALYKTGFGLNPYISYAESFRATVGTDIVTNTALKPRKGEQLEVGLKYQPPGSRSYVTVAYFDLEEDNLVEFVAGGQTQPGLSIETEGFEIEAVVNFGDFEVDFDFRNLDASDVDAAGNATVRSSLPENAGSIWATWEPSAGQLAGFRFGAGARYAGESEDNGVAFLAANGFAPTPNRVVTDSYTLFDGLVGYAFDSVDLTLNVRNLTDEDFYATCLSRGDCFPGEGRTITARAAYRF
ncbi:MAG: TonB-dependent siderophore receptor [Pseudomonadota bacterium]